MIKKYFFLLLLIAFSFISVWNLFHPGYPLTHDGDVHLLRLTNFYESLKEGNIVPRWAANVNFGYGQPVFEFFYPFPLYLASFFHFIGFSFSDGLKILLVAGMLLSGVAMFFWLEKIFGKKAGFVGGLLYIFAPFRFVDTYVRGDIGENLAFIFVPLVLLCIYKIKEKPSLWPALLGAVSLALLILTHNVMSLIFLPFIFIYALLCFLSHDKRRLFAGYFFWMIILGFSLSSFFWMPGLLEGKYTLRNIVTKGEYKDRFVFFPSLIYGPWSYGITGQFTVQIGIMQWLILILSSILTVFYFIKKSASKIKKDHQIILIASVIVYTVLGIFFMLPFSNFIWSKIILLQNFQFPWRFLAVTVFGSSVLGAYLVQFISKRYCILSLAVIVILILFFNRDYMHAKEFIFRSDNYFSGIQRSPADTGESSPIWGIRFMEHGFKNPLEQITGKAIIIAKKRTTTEHIYLVIVKEKSRLLENTLYFPGWEISANGKKQDIEFQDEQYRGLMTFYLDPGTYNIDVKFVSTKLRRIADAISLFTVFICIIILILLISKPRVKNK